MRTIEQVRQDWRLRGITLASWARDNGFKPQDVRDVLRKKAKGNFGAAYAIAVQLGIRPCKPASVVSHEQRQVPA